MSDLIERLERWGRDEGLQNHFIGSRSARKDCAEAATALAEAEATIARQQVMLDRALEASFDDKARADRAEAALRECPPTSNPTISAEDHIKCIDAWWRNWARPALSRPHATKGETG